MPRIRCPIAAVAILCGLVFIGSAWAQVEQPTVLAEPNAARPMPENNPNFDHQAEAKVFSAAIDAWRQTLSAMREVMIRFNNDTDIDEDALRQRYKQLEQEGRTQFDTAFASALRLLQNAPRESFEAARFLLVGAHYRFKCDWYEQTGEAVEALLRVGVKDPKLSEIAGASFFATCQFDKAEQYLRAAEAAGDLSEKSFGMLGAIEECRRLWEQELALRRQDAEKGDLPRVRLTTTRGDIVLELFEDQAPNTVANFISLVEQGQYDNAPFYQVISGRIAMIGDAHGDRAGSMGYMIADENVGPEKRTMFRGSVAMAKLPTPGGEGPTTIPNTASSHFLIGYVPLTPVNEEHTIFGRVIEGLPTLSAITRLDPSKEKAEGEPADVPDRIISAVVLRKRDHPYEPERIPLADVPVAPPAAPVP